MADEAMQAPVPEAPKNDNEKRRGVVLVAVLIVVASLSIVSYYFSDSMSSEQKASEYGHRNVQARALADSGIHYATALLSNPKSFTQKLAGNFWNNPDVFGNQALKASDGKLLGYFSIVAPADPDDSAAAICQYGVMDESSKINPNAMMKLDPTGQTLLDKLVKLPNMTDEIASNIVAFMGGSAGAAAGGVGNDYYGNLKPPYRIKGGPLDSIDELLLVKDVTPALLYGSDANRNGFMDEGEQAAEGFDRGLSAYLTVYSREQNCDPFTGEPYIFINNTDLKLLSENLTKKQIPDDMIKFLVMYQQYGPANAAGKSQSTGSSLMSLLTGGASSSSTKTVPGDLASYQPNYLKSLKYPLKSLFDLVGAQVGITKVVPGAKGKSSTVTTVYSSPLNDLTRTADLLTALFTVCTFTDPLTTPELPPRINVNTAPAAVLTAIGLPDADVVKIVEARRKLDPTQSISNTPAWLVTEAQVSITTLRDFAPYLSARTQVYRIQSIGYFDAKGPTIRVEAVIDTNIGRPRILAWRDLSELGKGLPEVSK
ncbi:MAG: general secretion pathway protein GspK [Planctomycetes bacterium]|nr:general secretion pathway protein GspK [Planctomycetota bacterium]